MATERELKEKADRVRFNANNARLLPIINPLRQSAYSCDVEWSRIGGQLDDYARDYGNVELNPGFQRGHVWTEAQQIHYVENALRGIVAQTAFVIQLNCPNWESDEYKGDLPHGMRGLYRFRVEMFTFQSRADLLKHYLDLNTGGTPHSQEEIARETVA